MPTTNAQEIVDDIEAELREAYESYMETTARLKTLAALLPKTKMGDAIAIAANQGHSAADMLALMFHGLNEYKSMKQKEQ